MSTQDINLSEHFDEFVAAEIGAGRYRDASEVLRAGLRLLELQRQEDEKKLAHLKGLAAEGLAELDQGLGIELNSEEELADFMARLS